MATSEMVERVARAIFDARYDGPYKPTPWVAHAARAAIAAMQEHHQICIARHTSALSDV